MDYSLGSLFGLWFWMVPKTGIYKDLSREAFGCRRLCSSALNLKATCFKVEEALLFCSSRLERGSF